MLKHLFQIMNKYFVFRTIFFRFPITIRGISNHLKISPSTVFRMVKELQREKLIKIKIYGRSYMIYPNFENKVGKYLLLASEALFTEKKFREMPELLDFLDEKSEIILLYGSRAEDYYLDTSDYDILKLWKEMKREEFEEEILEGNPFILSILSKHVVLKGFEEWVDFVWKSLSGALKLRMV